MVITEEEHEIEADYIVLATNSPVSNKYNVLIKQFPFRTYVIAAKIKKTQCRMLCIGIPAISMKIH
jgi:hypothetical protein